MSNFNQYYQQSPALSKNVLTIGAVLGVGIGSFLVYKQFKNKKKEKEAEAVAKIEVSKSSPAVVSAVNDVKALVKKNPKTMSYSIAQYKAMADMIELAIKETPADHTTVLRVFGNCKTKTDVLLIIGYFGVRTYQATSINDIKILNLFQFLHIPLISNAMITGINNTLKKRNIDYTFF